MTLWQDRKAADSNHVRVGAFKTPLITNCETELLNHPPLTIRIVKNTEADVMMKETF